MIFTAPNLLREKRRTDVVDTIINHHRHATATPLKKLPESIPKVLSTVTMGLGDTMMLTDLPKAAKQQKKGARCFSGSPHFLPLMSMNPYWNQIADKAFMVNAPDLIRQYDCGNGHYLQRIRRAFGLEVDVVPKGFIKFSGFRKNSSVIMHFEPGIHARWQRTQVHPKARMLYPETKLELEKFIQERKDLKFIQIGKEPLQIKGSYHMQTSGTVELVKEIAKAGWFIGFMSGPMHVATALDLKCVVMVNFPEAHQIVVPTLKVAGLVEEEWFYPQNVHLHQDAGAELVPKVNCFNLHAAFNGEIYPFWSDKYCDLIEDK